MSAFAVKEPPRPAKPAPAVAPVAKPAAAPAAKPRAQAPIEEPIDAGEIEPPRSARAGVSESAALRGDASVPVGESVRPDDEDSHDAGGDDDESTAFAGARDGGEPVDEETEWRGVYEEFVELKQQLGEPVDKLTYDKFRGTLQRNKDALVARHGCERVAFKVYEKQGRAALKASPVK